VGLAVAVQTLRTRYLFVVAYLFAGLATGWSQAGLGVLAEAHHSGTYGLRVSVSGSPYFLSNTAMETRNTFRARFYFRLDGLDLDQDQTALVFSGRDAQGVDTFRVMVASIDNVHRLGFEVRLNDGSYAPLLPVDGPLLTAGWHGLEFAWRAATPGGLDFWLDGVALMGLGGLDNDSRLLDEVSIGLIDGETSTYGGFVDFDDFEARQQGEIGTLCFALAEISGQFPQWPQSQSILNLVVKVSEACNGP